MTDRSTENDARLWDVSVLLADPPHPYATNPRLTVRAATTDEIYDLVARRYPSGVVMRIDPSRKVIPPGSAAFDE